MARSAGSYAQLMAREGKFATIKLPSGETRLVLSNCYATIGVVSNSDHQLTVSGKAGRTRWLGRRPRTRTVAMNPVDHPMGGGEGRASVVTQDQEKEFQRKDSEQGRKQRKVINILSKEEINNYV